MFAAFDFSHPVVLAALLFLMVSSTVLIVKLFRRKRPGKHTPWARLYDKELH
jgi:hypothetical protein